eukprot:s1820_g11.t1
MRWRTNGLDLNRYKWDLCELHGFWNSRRGGVQQVPDPEAERVLPLEQELKDLREALLNRRVHGHEPLGTYGAQPFQRVGPATVHPEAPQQTQWRLNQACNDVNLRDWARVNDVQGGPSAFGMPSAGHQPCDHGGAGPDGRHPGGLPGSDPWGMSSMPGQGQGQGNMMNPCGGGGHGNIPCVGHGNPWMDGMPQGDWLAHIRPQIADVSSRAMVWWDELMRVTMERYHQKGKAAAASPAGGSGGSGGGGNKGSPNGKGGKDGGKNSNKGTPTKDNQKGGNAGNKDETKNIRKVEADGKKGNAGDQKGCSEAGTGETQTLVSEVSSLIKAFKSPTSDSSFTAHRHVKAVNIRKIDMGKNQRVLIDGGQHMPYEKQYLKKNGIVETWFKSLWHQEQQT